MSDFAQSGTLSGERFALNWYTFRVSFQKQQSRALNGGVFAKEVLMKRFALNSLLQWRQNGDNTPLVLDGARRVGKTWLLQELGRVGFQRTLYLNLENNPNAYKLFRSLSGTQALLSGLEKTYNIPIDENTLLIFDEAQFAPDIFSRIKPLCEDVSWLRIAVAGSLMGLALQREMAETDNKYSYPGNARNIKIYPMTFKEFLVATGNSNLLSLDSQNINIKSHNILRSYALKYMITGGLPQCINMFLQGDSFEDIREYQFSVLSLYERDFAKHVSTNETTERLRQLWQSIARQALNRKAHRHFNFKLIRKGGKRKEYEMPLAWLKDSGLIYCIHSVESVSHRPLTGYISTDIFRVHIFDIGLLGAMLHVPPTGIPEDDPAYSDIRGAFAEQFVAQELISESIHEKNIFYWSYGNYEVDFLVESSDKGIFPIEVKYSNARPSESLSKYIHKYSPKYIYLTSFGCSQGKDESCVKSIPIYAISSVMQ